MPIKGTVNAKPGWGLRQGPRECSPGERLPESPPCPRRSWRRNLQLEVLYLRVRETGPASGGDAVEGSLEEADLQPVQHGIEDHHPLMRRSHVADPTQGYQRGLLPAPAGQFAAPALMQAGDVVYIFVVFLFITIYNKLQFMDSYSFRRDLESRLRFISGLPVLVLIGARRTGKTTLLRIWYSRIEERKAWLDGDNPAHLLAWERLLAGQDPESWLASLLGTDAYGNGYLVLDEAQGFAAVSQLVKVLVDALPGLRVAMSGSSALKLKDFTSESMAGRKQLLELYPLTLKERLTPVPPALKASSAPGVLQEMLVWGGFPGVLALPEGWQRVGYLTEVLDSTLYRDLLHETRSRDVTSLKRLLVYLARSIGGKLNTSNLAATLELSRVTTHRYLNLLVEASVLLLLPGVDARGIVPKAQPKPYFTDNGLLSMLMADDRPFLARRTEDQGNLLENFVVGEFHKRLHYGEDRLTQLGYLWDKRGELDLVAHRQGAIQAAWEVKLSETQGGSKATRDAIKDIPLTVLNLNGAARLLLD